MNIYINNYEIEGVPLTVGRNCLLASIRDILGFYRVEISEWELYFLCRAFCFSSRPLYKRPVILSDWFYYDQHQRIEKYIKESFFCDYQFYSDFNRKKIVEHLNANRPLSVLLHPRFITYNHRIFQPVGMQEMHCFNIYGYDNNNKEYYVADSTVTDDNGTFISMRARLDYSIVEKKAIGYFVFNSPPVYQATGYELLPIIVQMLDEFLSDLGNESEIKGIKVLQKIFTSTVYQKDNHYNELSFLLQAYFMPLFFYLEKFFTFIVKSNEIISIVKREKNKWDIFFYKYLLRLKKDCNENMMLKCFERNMENFPTFLTNVCNCIYNISMKGKRSYG